MYESFRSINKIQYFFFAGQQFDEGALANIFSGHFTRVKDENAFNALLGWFSYQLSSVDNTRGFSSGFNTEAINASGFFIEKKAVEGESDKMIENDSIERLNNIFFLSLRSPIITSSEMYKNT